MKRSLSEGLVYNLDNITEVARKFIDEIGKNRIFLFDGEMGAGKTTFIAEVCRLLGADDDFGSPTFSLVNEYADKEGRPIYHFDFYRIDNPQEALEIGVEDYFYSGNLCFVEWPDRLGNLIPEEAVVVRIEENPDNSRKISLHV